MKIYMTYVRTLYIVDVYFGKWGCYIDYVSFAVVLTSNLTAKVKAA